MQNWSAVLANVLRQQCMTPVVTAQVEAACSFTWSCVLHFRSTQEKDKENQSELCRCMQRPLDFTGGSSLTCVCACVLLKAPLNDPRACASLMGLKPSTTKSHLVRAILESVAFRWLVENHCRLLVSSSFMLTGLIISSGISSCMRRCSERPAFPSQRSGKGS